MYGDEVPQPHSSPRSNARTEAILREMAERVAEQHGLELYDVVYRRSGPRAKLQVFLSRAAGAITLEDCERVSRQLSRELDVEDPIQQAYDLEVSSPGIERPLRSPWHFRRASGERASVRWRDDAGRTQSAVLVIKDADGEQVTFAGPDGQDVKIAISAVLSAKIHVDW